MTSLGASYHGYRFPPAVISHVWSAPPLQGESSRRWGKPFASMYPAYWWSPGLLALMESARTDPHNAGGHDRPLTDSGWRCAGRRLGHHIKRSSQFEDGRVRLGHAGRIRLVHLLGREYFPADPYHLVGERDHRDLA